MHDATVTEEIRRGLETIIQPGEVFEVRAIKIPNGKYPPITASGYFDNIDDAARCIEFTDR